jgi:hypothetical protein
VHRIALHINEGNVQLTLLLLECCDSCEREGKQHDRQGQGTGSDTTEAIPLYVCSVATTCMV